MTFCKFPELQFSHLQNGVIVHMLWMGVGKEGDDGVCEDPPWCLAHLASNQKVGVHKEPLISLQRGGHSRSEQLGRWQQ